MSGRDKKNRRNFKRALDLTFDKALESLKKQINAYPLKYRVKIAWLILFKKF